MEKFQKSKVLFYIYKIYFIIHDFIDTRFFYYISKFFKVPHPHNLYLYRNRDFLNNINSSDRVADLGCGTGKLTLLIAKKAQFVLGIDWNTPLLNLENTEFIKKDITDADLKKVLLEKNINCIVISHILEHLKEPVFFLKNLRAFKKILICVPSQENWRFQFKTALGLDARTDPTHYREYTVEMLRSEVEQSSLHLKQIYYNSEAEIFAICETV